MFIQIIKARTRPKLRNIEQYDTSFRGRQKTRMALRALRTAAPMQILRMIFYLFSRNSLLSICEYSPLFFIIDKVVFDRHIPPRAVLGV